MKLKLPIKERSFLNALEKDVKCQEFDIFAAGSA